MINKQDNVLHLYIEDTLMELFISTKNVVVSKEGILAVISDTKNFNCFQIASNSSQDGKPFPFLSLAAHFLQPNFKLLYSRRD